MNAYGLCYLEISFFYFTLNIYLRLILDRSLMLAFSNSVNLKSDFGEGVICAWTIRKKAKKSIKKTPQILTSRFMFLKSWNTLPFPATFVTEE